MAIDYDLLKQLINGQITRNEYEAKVAEKEAIEQAQKIAASSDAKLLASANIQITAAKTYALQKIQTSAAAWVTLYVSAAARTADASRNETTDPLPGAGVIAEVITSDGAIQNITPGTLGWNDESTPTTDAYLKVVNKSGSTQAITVTLHFVALEA